MKMREREQTNIVPLDPREKLFAILKENGELILDRFLSKYSISSALVYGAGSIGIEIYELLLKKGCKVEIVDQKPLLINSHYHISGTDLIMRDSFDAIIITSVYSYVEIKKYLITSEIDIDSIFSVDEIIFDEVDEKRRLNKYTKQLYADIKDNRKINLEHMPSEFTYGNALDLMYMISNTSIYRLFLNNLFETKEVTNRRKRRKNVALLMEYTSIFAFKEIYNKLKKNKDIHVYAILTWIRPAEEYRKQREKCISYFNENNMEYCEIIGDINAELPEEYYPDILFIQRFYYDLQVQRRIWLRNIRCDCLIWYVPYSFWNTLYCDQTMCSDYTFLCNRIFAPSIYHKEFFCKWIGVDNNSIQSIVKFSGYPKADPLQRKRNFQPDKAKMNIVYAPGIPQRVDDTNELFESNLFEILELAKEYKEVNWILRPHPSMIQNWRDFCEIKSQQEMMDYLDEWDCMENGVVNTDADYSELFLGSNGMITDSISFLIMYQYTNHPLYFYDHSGWRFNDLGNKALGCVYKASEMNIRDYIQKVVWDGCDILKEKRDVFFINQLNYINDNGVDAKEYICKELYNVLIES